MNALKRTAMMYRAVKAEYNVNFNKDFFQLNDAEMTIICDFAELFYIRQRYGWSQARTLFYRLAKYEEKYIRTI